MYDIRVLHDSMVSAISFFLNYECFIELVHACVNVVFAHEYESNLLDYDQRYRMLDPNCQGLADFPSNILILVPMINGWT